MVDVQASVGEYVKARASVDVREGMDMIQSNTVVMLMDGRENERTDVRETIAYRPEESNSAGDAATAQATS